MSPYSITPATEPIWGLVCGFAGRQRDKRWLLMPKAYIDDSGRRDHSPVMVLAGFAAPVDKWLPFADDWQAVLDLNPPIQYFRAYEAVHCVGEFNFFSKERRDQRVKMLCDVLDKHLPTQVYCIVVLDDFRKVIEATSAPEWMHNPYYVAFWTLISVFAQNQQRVGFTEPMDFVFDDQAEKKRIRNAWDSFVELAPDHVRPFIGIEPAFLDDRKIKQLQAADLMAWHTREWNEGMLTRDLKKVFNTSLPMFGGEYQGLGVKLDEPFLLNMFRTILKTT